MLSTKISLYLGTSPLPLPPSPPKIGAWAVLHEIRSEWAQLMSVVYLMIVGPGPLSVDAIIARARAHRKPAGTRRRPRGAGTLVTRPHPSLADAPFKRRRRARAGVLHAETRLVTDALEHQVERRLRRAAESA